jgi:hypothetical protein
MDKDLLTIRQRILDLLDTAERQSIPRFFHFLSPAEQGAAEAAARHEGWKPAAKDTADGSSTVELRERNAVDSAQSPFPQAPITRGMDRFVPRFCVV